MVMSGVACGAVFKTLEETTRIIGAPQCRGSSPELINSQYMHRVNSVVHATHFAWCKKCHISANTRRSPNAGLMLGQRRRRIGWTSRVCWDKVELKYSPFTRLEQMTGIRVNSVNLSWQCNRCFRGNRWPQCLLLSLRSFCWVRHLPFLRGYNSCRRIKPDIFSSLTTCFSQ